MGKALLVFILSALLSGAAYAGPPTEGTNQLGLLISYNSDYDIELGMSVSIIVDDGGKLSVAADMNNCGVDEFGDTTFCTEMAPRWFENISLEDVTEAEAPGQAQQFTKRLYKFTSPNVGRPSRLSPLTNGARLIVKPSGLKIKVPVMGPNGASVEGYRFLTLNPSVNLRSIAD